MIPVQIPRIWFQRSAKNHRYSRYSNRQLNLWSRYNKRCICLSGLESFQITARTWIFHPTPHQKKKRSLSCPSEAMRKKNSVTCHEIHGLLILEMLVMAFYNHLWNWIVNPKQLGSLSPLLTSQLTANYVLCSSNPKDPQSRGCFKPQGRSTGTLV